MLNSFGETGNLYAKHNQAPHTTETSKQSVGVPWGYNAQLDGLYSYPTNPQPLYNIQYEGERKHPDMQYKHPQVSAVVKCNEACCQYLNEGPRFPLNPSPLRFPAPRHVPAQRYDELPNNCFAQTRMLNPLNSKSAQVNCYPHLVQDNHPSRGNKTRDSTRQPIRPAPPQYPIYHYWPQRDWNGQNPPPPPPYPHPPQPKQPNQLQHYPQQSRLVKNQTELSRNIPQRRPNVDYQMQQEYYDFNRGYSTGFLPFNDGISAQIGDTSCKTNDIHYPQPHQYAVQNDKVINNHQVPDLMYARHYPNDNLYFNLRASQHSGSVVQMPHHHHRQYEQTTRKRPDLDVRQFLATWEDDEEETRAVEAAADTQGQPFIVLDCSGLEGDALARVQEKLKGQNVQLFPTKNIQDTSQRQVVDSVERSIDQQSNIVYSGNEQFTTQDQPRKTHSVGESYNQIDKHLKDLLQPLDCSKRDGIEPGILSRREPLLQNQSSVNERHPNETNNNPMSFDALVTYYGDNRRSDMAYDLVEITERLVSAADKICNGGNAIEQPSLKENHIIPNHMLPESFLTNNVAFTENYNPSDKPHSAFNDYSIPPGILPQESNKVFAVSSHQSNTQFTIKNIVSPTDKEALTNMQSASLISDRKELDFLQEDPEQFVKSTILKKSDYAKLPKFSPPKKLRRLRECGKNVYDINSEHNVDNSRILSKSISFSAFNNEGETYDGSENIVTLHAEVQCGEQQSPYVQKYSRVITLSEGLASSSSKNPTTVDQAPSEQNTLSITTIADSSHGGGSLQRLTPDKAAQSIDASPVSFKLKRIPNSKEWVKIDKSPSPKIVSPLFGGGSSVNKDNCFTSMQASSPQNKTSHNANNNNGFSTESPCLNIHKASTNLSMPTLEDIHDDSIIPFINSPKSSKSKPNQHLVINKPMTVIHSTERSALSNLVTQQYSTNETTVSNSDLNVNKSYIKKYCTTEFVKQPEKLQSFGDERPITLIYSSPNDVDPSCADTSFIPPLKLNSRLCDTDTSFDYRIPTSPATDDMFDDINRLSNPNSTSFLNATSYLQDTSKKEVPAELNCDSSTCEFPFYSNNKDNKAVSHIENVICESDKEMRMEFSGCDNVDDARCSSVQKNNSEQTSCNTNIETVNSETSLSKGSDGINVITYTDVVGDVMEAKRGDENHSQNRNVRETKPLSPVANFKSLTGNNKKVPNEPPISLIPGDIADSFRQDDVLTSLDNVSLGEESESKENEPIINGVEQFACSSNTLNTVIIPQGAMSLLESKSLYIKNDVPVNSVSGTSLCPSLSNDKVAQENTALNSSTIVNNTKILLSVTDLSSEDKTQIGAGIANSDNKKQFSVPENIDIVNSAKSQRETVEDSASSFFNLENIRKVQICSDATKNPNEIHRNQSCSNNGNIDSLRDAQSNALKVAKYTSEIDSKTIVQEQGTTQVVEKNYENNFLSGSFEHPCEELASNKQNDNNTDSNGNEDIIDSESTFSDQEMDQDPKGNLALHSDDEVSAKNSVYKVVNNCENYIHSPSPTTEDNCGDDSVVNTQAELHLPMIPSLSANENDVEKCFENVITIGGCEDDSLSLEDPDNESKDPVQPDNVLTIESCQSDSLILEDPDNEIKDQFEPDNVLTPESYQRNGLSLEDPDNEIKDQFSPDNVLTIESCRSNSLSLEDPDNEVKNQFEPDNVLTSESCRSNSLSLEDPHSHIKEQLRPPQCEKGRITVESSLCEQITDYLQETKNQSSHFHSCNEDNLFNSPLAIKENVGNNNTSGFVNSQSSLVVNNSLNKFDLQFHSPTASMHQVQNAGSLYLQTRNKGANCESSGKNFHKLEVHSDVDRVSASEIERTLSDNSVSYGFIESEQSLVKDLMDKNGNQSSYIGIQHTPLYEQKNKHLPEKSATVITDSERTIIVPTLNSENDMHKFTNREDNNCDHITSTDGFMRSRHTFYQSQSLETHIQKSSFSLAQAKFMKSTKTENEIADANHYGEKNIMNESSCLDTEYLMCTEKKEEYIEESKSPFHEQPNNNDSTQFEITKLAVEENVSEEHVSPAKNNLPVTIHDNDNDEYLIEKERYNNEMQVTDILTDDDISNRDFDVETIDDDCFINSQDSHLSGTDRALETCGSTCRDKPMSPSQDAVMEDHKVEFKYPEEHLPLKSNYTEKYPSIIEIVDEIVIQDVNSSQVGSFSGKEGALDICENSGVTKTISPSQVIVLGDHTTHLNNYDKNEPTLKSSFTDTYSSIKNVVDEIGIQVYENDNLPVEINPNVNKIEAFSSENSDFKIRAETSLLLDLSQEETNSTEFPIQCSVNVSQNEGIHLENKEGISNSNDIAIIHLHSLNTEIGSDLTNESKDISFKSTDLKDTQLTVPDEIGIPASYDETSSNNRGLNASLDKIGSEMHEIAQIHYNPNKEIFEQKLIGNYEESIDSIMPDKQNSTFEKLPNKIAVGNIFLGNITCKNSETVLIKGNEEAKNKLSEDKLVDSAQIIFSEIPLPIGPMPLHSLLVQYSSEKLNLAQEFEMSSSQHTNDFIGVMCPSSNEIEAGKYCEKTYATRRASAVMENPQYIDKDFSSLPSQTLKDCGCYLENNNSCCCGLIPNDKLVDYSCSSSNSPGSQSTVYSPYMPIVQSGQDAGNDHDVNLLSSDTDSVSRDVRLDVIKSRKSFKEESIGDDSDDELLSIYVSENLLGDENSLSCNDDDSNSCSMASSSSEASSLCHSKITLPISKDALSCVTNSECTCNVLGQFKCFKSKSTLENESSSVKSLLFVDLMKAPDSHSNSMTSGVLSNVKFSENAENFIIEHVSGNEPANSREEHELKKLEFNGVSLLTSNCMLPKISDCNESGDEIINSVQNISLAISAENEKLQLTEMGHDKLKQEGSRVEEVSPLRLPLTIMNENKISFYNPETTGNLIPICSSISAPSFENVPPADITDMFNDEKIEQINVSDMPALEPADNDSLFIGKLQTNKKKLSDDKSLKSVTKEKKRVRIKFKGGNWKKRSQSNKIPSGRLAIQSKKQAKLGVLETDLTDDVTKNIKGEVVHVEERNINKITDSAEHDDPVNEACNKYAIVEDIVFNFEHFNGYKDCCKENEWDLEGKYLNHCTMEISFTDLASGDVLKSDDMNGSSRNVIKGTCETGHVPSEILQCLRTESDAVDAKATYVSVIQDTESIDKVCQSLVSSVSDGLLLHNITINTTDPLVDSAYWNSEKSLASNDSFSAIEPPECSVGFNAEVSKIDSTHVLEDSSKLSDPCDVLDQYAFHDDNLHREYQFVPIDDFCGLETLAEVVSSACIRSEASCFNDLSSEVIDLSENKTMELENVPYTNNSSLSSDNSERNTEGFLSSMVDLHYEDINDNIIHDVSNWPYVEEEVHDCDYIDFQDSKDDSVDLKCRLRWDRIFNGTNSKKRKCETSNEPKSTRGLELGPAKVEVRLGVDSNVDTWKVKKCKTSSRPPVVNVGRLILKRDPELNSYSEESRTSSFEYSDDSRPHHSSVYSEDSSLPRVIIRKKSGTEYMSYLSVSDNWQPVVELKRSEYIDKLALECAERAKLNDERSATWAMRRTMMQKKKRKALAIKRPNSEALPDDIVKSRRLQDDSNALHSFHCRSCLLHFDTQDELVDHRYSEHCGRRELHHCLLCQRSYSTFDRYLLHVTSRSHRHLELSQRSTIHAVHRLLTDKDCPSLRPLSEAETEVLDWWPRHNGYKHFYHQPTPLQIALQEKTDYDPS